ncbi:hypothetical protein ACHAO8_001066 [Botrytis cinerea]
MVSRNILIKQPRALQSYLTTKPGLSTIGLLNSTTLPPFLKDNPLPCGVPWGNTEPGGAPPHTGVVRRYKWTVSRSIKAPDGVEKNSILINDQFPGPLVEANWGDMIEVEVTNAVESAAEGITIHWHGQPQKENPWYDGVPAVTQCPIAPNTTFTYRFRAESFGSGWYHSHVSGQYADGLFGPMVVYGPSQLPYDIDLGPIVLSDHIYTSYFQVLEQGLGVPLVFPTVGNNLINGKGTTNCSSIANGTNCTPGAPLAKFAFQTGKTHRLRLMNTGSSGTQKFSIDGHSMTVIAQDYVPIKPYTTNVVTLGLGQRTDVLIKATGSASGSYWMRSDLDVACMQLETINSHALASVYYPQAQTSSEPNTTAYSWDSNNCLNDPLNTTVPYYALSPPRTPSLTQNLQINAGPNASGVLLFYMNNSTFRGDYNAPILLLESSGNTSYPEDPSWNVYNFGNHTSIRIIIQNIFPIYHPMHLHGHDFWILAIGTGEWDGRVVNPDNPQRRDTILMPPGSPDVPSYLVIEYMADNPGVWPLHCHIGIHLSAGMLINTLERPDLVKKRRVPYVMAQTCRDWANFSGTNLVDQIDSGL